LSNPASNSERCEKRGKKGFDKASSRRRTTPMEVREKKKIHVTQNGRGKGQGLQQLTGGKGKERKKEFLTEYAKTTKKMCQGEK